MNNMGNMGNMGNSGNLGVSSGGGDFFTDRVDLPFVTETAALGTNPNVPVASLRLKEDLWEERNWNSEWYAWLVVDEFTQTDWRSKVEFDPNTGNGLAPWDDALTSEELDKLVKMAEDERADAMGEILAQAESYLSVASYFMNLLSVNAGSHPATARLLQIAGLVAIPPTVYAKAHASRKSIPAGSSPPAVTKNQPRPRPSHLLPALLSPLPTPGHPSHPSGHSTQAHLMALCLSNALQGARKDVLSPLLKTLAGRIGRNREIAGLHYPSDTKAGAHLADIIFDILKDLPHYKTTHGQAEMEWQ
ncbi:phosphatase PAP2 family protein [Paracraurococcus ruber]|uniref:Phosphatidic acid phosphatase type 2/haloperoxidase domain-containing protein n=1 Tax=Paracraurococcus ruber TaxID=77675 RepID=A0ABS1D3S0_9PROT|nr:phosphatase PAP2 family protein [Paracraurococcus ruber]MBK1661201.1 hypothetical protein [Paracraurococcus ruber]TDG28118.1 phosphatase PAP2 family protein [Paracraurococcus ruber]